MSKEYDELIARSREASLLGSCTAVLGWDERTFLPPAAGAHRGEQMALLARLTHEKITHPRVGELIEFLSGVTLMEEEAANYRELKRTHERAKKVPAALVADLAQVTSQAQGVWQESKQNNDFASFRPWLERIVGLKRQEAECVGYQDSPYDALVDEFEPGTHAVELKVLLSGLAQELVPLVAELVEKQKPTREDLWRREFPVVAQESLCRQAAAAVGFDFQRGRLDTTAHPFCTGIGPGDCRILTRYHINRPFESFFGTLHEAGHGLYEQGLPPDRFGTPLGVAASFGIHESQSRLWENQIGRSRAFWAAWYPKFHDAFPAQFADVTEEQLWRAANTVRPSLIRIDADEATYNLHIIMRFELELGLLTGDLPVADLPAAWNAKIREYFGIAVPDDAHGCLQDIHWSFGGIGYFPTYTLGNLYAAQFMDAAQRDLPGLWEDVQRGQFGRLSHWLHDKIHRHGQRFRPAELCRRITGRSLNPQPFLSYLRTKFLDN
jgi:carboxypeptidase Taq